jgi:tetratricopeptide (TPR) repeat protein
LSRGHVFISYSKKHRDLTVALADHLSTCGLLVWWDKELVARGRFDDQLFAELVHAGAVVVIWTRGALTSDWVRREAMFALERDMLVNVVATDVDQSELPEPFRHHHRHRPLDYDLILRDVLAVREGRLLLDPKTERLPANPAPSLLLQARFGLIPFVDASPSKEDLLAWCRQTDTSAAGRIIHAPGGTGKTRLLIEVAAVLRADGWSAGFYDRPATGETIEAQERRQKATRFLIRGATDKGLHYAEGREQDVVAFAMAMRSATTRNRPLRLVLLARSAGSWWEDLRNEVPEVEHLFRETAKDQRPFGQRTAWRAEQRLELFVACVRGLALALAERGYTLPSQQPSVERLQRMADGDGYCRPLAIGLEALLYLMGESPESGADVAALLDQMLGVERAHWRKLLAQASTLSADIERGLAQVTSVQGVSSRPAAEGLLRADGYYGETRHAPVALRDIIQALERFYGRDGGITALEPDLVGERQITRVIDTELVSGCVQWMQALPDAERDRSVRAFLTVLDRATTEEHGRAGDAVLVNLEKAVLLLVEESAGAIVDVARQGVGRLPIAMLSALETMSVEQLMLVADEMPLQTVRLARVVHRTSELITARTAAAARFLDKAELTTVDCEALDTYGTALHNEAARRLRAGEFEVALERAQQAVVVRRRLAARTGAEGTADLARTLKNLADVLRKLNRPDDAVTSSQEALAIWRRLAAADPATFEPGLPSLMLPQESMEEAKEVLAFRRAAANSEDLETVSWLAAGLNTLSVHLTEAGRFREALAASEEAHGLVRRLAEADPDTYLEELAFCLNNISADYDHLGQSTEAMAASDEAVRLFRLLADREPDAHLPDLAASLHNLSLRHSAHGEPAAAHASAQEALRLNQRLAERSIDVFGPEVASSLDRLAVTSQQVGDEEAAVLHARAAVEMFRKISVNSGDRYRGGLACALNNLSIILRDCIKEGSNRGFRDEALEASGEAVRLFKALSEAGHGVYAADVVRALGMRAELLLDDDDARPAFGAAEEALKLLPPLLVDNAEGLSALATSLAQTYSTAADRLNIHPDPLVLSRLQC